MLLHLDDATTLEARTRRPLVIAAAIAGATLCPLVCALMVGTVFHSALTLRELALWLGWAAALGALVAGGVLHTGVRSSRRQGAVMSRSLLGGWLYPMAVFGPWWLLSLPDMMGLGVFSVLAAVAGVPCGLVFGILFSCGSIPAHRALTAPSHEGPAIGWQSGAMLLGVAGLAALFLSYPLEGPYCETFFSTLLPALVREAPPGLDIAWTRHLVLPALPVLAAVFFAVRAWRLRAALERTARALEADEHPRWQLCERPPEARVLPLRARDRDGALLICARVEGHGTYRAAPEALAQLDPRA